MYACIHETYFCCTQGSANNSSLKTNRYYRVNADVSCGKLKALIVVVRKSREINLPRPQASDNTRCCYFTTSEISTDYVIKDGGQNTRNSLRM